MFFFIWLRIVSLFDDPNKGIIKFAKRESGDKNQSHFIGCFVVWNLSFSHQKIKLWKLDLINFTALAAIKNKPQGMYQQIN